MGANVLAPLVAPHARGPTEICPDCKKTYNLCWCNVSRKYGWLPTTEDEGRAGCCRA